MMERARIKILYVHHGTGMGGAPQLLLRLMQQLDMTVYEPVVWCIRQSTASDLFERNGFAVVYNRDVIPFLHISDGFYGFRQPHRVLKMLFGQIASFRAARMMFARIQPDLIHLNSVVIPGVLCAAARVGCPVVVNVLECLHPGYTGLRRFLFKLLTKRWADAFVFMLPSEARRWGLAGKVNAVSVFDFIDLGKFLTQPENELRTDYNVAGDTPLIGYLGRFTRAKGVHLLVEALSMLKRRGQKFRALLIGPMPADPPATRLNRLRRRIFGPPYFERLRTRISAEGLNGIVSFVGERLEVERLVAQFDLLVVPFIEPHFSRLCGEAAAAGKPAIAFKIDGPGEEIIDGVTGLLAQPFSAKDLADKIEFALAHPYERRQMGGAGKARAADVFDGKKNMDEVLSLYRWIGV